MKRGDDGVANGSLCKIYSKPLFREHLIMSNRSYYQRTGTEARSGRLDKRHQRAGVYWASVVCIDMHAALEQYISKMSRGMAIAITQLLKEYHQTSHRRAVHYHGAQEYYPFKRSGCYWGCYRSWLSRFSLERPRTNLKHVTLTVT